MSFTPARPGTADELREEIAQTLLAHRLVDRSVVGVIVCACGWVGPFLSAHQTDAVLALPRVQRLLAVERERAALEQRVRELAADLDRWVQWRGSPASGSFDDGVSQAQTHAAARLRRALGGGDDA